jgi:hypothetical protein
MMEADQEHLWCVTTTVADQINLYRIGEDDVLRLVDTATGLAATAWHKGLGKLIIIALVLLHVAAIIFYRVKKGQNLVGPMLRGDKALPAGVPPADDSRMARLRALAGKPRLTHDYVLQEIEAYWSAGGRRMMWHLIGGLPSETDADAEELGVLLDDVQRLVPNGQRYHLEIGRQPFGPLPHTPMQWFRPGLSTERIGAVVARHVGGSRLAVVDKAGQSLANALVNTLVMRGGPEVRGVVLEGPPRLPRDARRAVGAWSSWVRARRLDPDRYLGAWDPDAPTPWDRVESGHTKHSIRRAYDRLARLATT